MTGNHLSDELLSVHIDGAAAGAAAENSGGAPDVEAHLATCRQCAARLASLRSVSELVRTPPAPVSAHARAAAIATAVAQASSEDTSPQAYPAGNAPAAPAYRLAWYRRPSALAGAAAAAVVVAALAVPLALGTSSPSRPSASKASRLPPASDENGALHKSAAASEPSVPAPQAAPALPDLGAIGSTAQLRSDVAALASSGAAKTTGPSASGSASGSASTAAPAVAPPPSGYSAPPPASTAEVVPCVQSARTAAHGGAYGPGEVATAIYQGTAALVMEFWPTPTAPSPAGAVGTQGVIAVVSQSDCAVLATTPT
jgi:hypothetical protein